jgi:energy-coupling factor transporter ATP-binding protein EcfA2
VCSVHKLQNDLHRVKVLLHQGAFVSLSSEEKERLLEDSLKLVRKLDAVAESSLVVGILGGTGVGKSSLMNAVAGVPIATTSHRRPHTGQVLIYHHTATPLPDALTKSPQPRHPITHEVEAVRHILLCDLPDFDSLLTGHQEQVLQFLEHLDILIWVTTPEKYADERFYTFLRQVPKARQNFYFVLNKVDLLFGDGKPGTGHSQLSTVLARFSQHLRDNGVAQPIIYAVSAREGGDASVASPWNHLWNLHNQIFRLRDAKEMREIKTANLDVEVKQLTEVLEKEVAGLNILHGVIKDSVVELENRRSEWNRMGHEAFLLALARNHEEFLRQPAQTHALVGIGYGIAAVVKDWKRLTERSDERLKSTDLLFQPADLQSLQHELERVEQRMIYQTLHRGLPSSIMDHGANFFDAGAEWAELWQGLQGVVARSLDHRWAQAFSGFRAVQYASYLALFLCLLVALSGDTGLQNLFERPSWYGMVGLISALIQTLFSPKGFAALGSYLLLQTFLGFRFYRHYKKLLQRQAQKFVGALQLVFERVWEEELNILIDRLTQKAQQVDKRIAALRALCSSGTED